MFEVRDALKAAFAEIDGVTVISSSWRASRKQFPLPAVICDWDGTTPLTTLEDGTVTLKQYSFPITAVVALTNVNDEDAEEALDAHVANVIAKLDEAMGVNNYTIQNWFPINIPWGKVEALADPSKS